MAQALVNAGWDAPRLRASARPVRSALVAHFTADGGEQFHVRRIERPHLVLAREEERERRSNCSCAYVSHALVSRGSVLVRKERQKRKTFA